MRLPKLKWNKIPSEHELIDNLRPEQLDQFASEANYIKNCGYWKWFIEDMRLLTERMMFTGEKKSIIFGKGMLYCLDIMQSNVAKMASGKVKTDSSEKKKMARFK